MGRPEQAELGYAIGDEFPRADSPVVAGAPRADSHETVFSVLAARARSHSRTHLALTTLIGLADAAALAWAHPQLWSMAALFAAPGAYGAWGLVDRALSDRVAAGSFDTPMTNVLRIVRVVIGVAGTLAAIAAVGGIWDASLGGWRH